jgi:hypothetical protein
VRTSRVRLREFTADDFFLLEELNNDPEVMWFITKGVPLSPEEVASFLGGVIAEYPINPGYGVFAGFNRESHGAAGHAAHPHLARRLGRLDSRLRAGRGRLPGHPRRISCRGSRERRDHVSIGLLRPAEHAVHDDRMWPCGDDLEESVTHFRKLWHSAAQHLRCLDMRRIS